MLAVAPRSLAFSPRARCTQTDGQPRRRTHEHRTGHPIPPRRLGADHLRPRRVEDIPEVGDTEVYDIVHDSLIIVRTGTGESDIRAYVNSCLHRGTILRTEGGNVRHIKCCLRRQHAHRRHQPETSSKAVSSAPTRWARPP